MNAISQIETPPRASKYTTRYASYDEGERIYIARLFVENLLPVARMHVDISTAIGSIYRAINEERMIVVERDGEIVGCAAFNVYKYWFSDQNFVFENGCFVIKKYRKTRASSVLFDALKSEAKKRNTVLIMGAGTRDPSVAETLKKRHPVLTTSFVVTP